MDLTKYQVFLKTVECGSFTAAAQQLSFTQSGVSHAISGLEEELGVTLLSRSRGGVTLTADGWALMPYIQEICASNGASRNGPRICGGWRPAWCGWRCSPACRCSGCPTS